MVTRVLPIMRKTTRKKRQVLPHLNHTFHAWQPFARLFPGLINLLELQKVLLMFVGWPAGKPHPRKANTRGGEHWAHLVGIQRRAPSLPGAHGVGAHRSDLSSLTAVSIMSVQS